MNSESAQNVPLAQHPLCCVDAAERHPWRRLYGPVLLLLMITHWLPVCVASQRFSERWRTAYAETDSTGSHVIGHWKFDEQNITQDSGPNAVHGKLNGAVAAADGKFGGAIESFPGWPVQDQRHQFLVPNHPALSPPGAFTVEMWVQAKPDLATAGGAYLLDKKYASHQGYQWLLVGPKPTGARQMQVNLGFGKDSESYLSDALEFLPGIWHHVAFTYDGAGTLRFYRDGSTVGVMTRSGRGAVVAGNQGLSIGDRLGSNYGGFPGFIDEVRICHGVLEFNPASLTIDVPRSAWVRREPAPEIRITVSNLQTEPLNETSLTLSGIGRPARVIAIPAIAAGGTHVVTETFDTSLRPDSYELLASLTVPDDPPVQREESLTLTLVARPVPHQMPVMMWGIGSPSGFETEMSRLKHLGFNQALGFGADYDAIWKAGQPITASSAAAIAATRQALDQALANQFGLAASLHPGYYLKKREELWRVDREGVPYERRDCNASLPGLAEFSENVGRSVVQTYGDHPAFVAALVNSEVRDDSQVCFSEFDRAAYRAFSGAEIPDEVRIKNGVQWTVLPDFPRNRVLPDNHPLLQYYRWFWTVGDGWNNLHSALHRGLKSTGRDDIYTWYDPAIRVPGVSGSGGDVDVLSQWTYTEPSPLRMGYFCDEVFAMAAASAHSPRVMKMTQLFWYRSTSAPLKTGSNYIASPFDDHDPDAAYISIAPMHLRGAFWSKVSRPISGLMYHGWSSLVQTDGSHAYKYTQPDLQTEFRRLHHDVLKPLAPMLLQVPDRSADVACLNSFTSQMFARRGSYGYGSDEAYLTLLHAQLQPEVILEETLLKRGLDAFKVLVLVDCDVLTESVVDRIQQFQKRGGMIIGDPNLCPAIQPDIVIPRFVRTKKAAEDQATILANAATLRQSLDNLYQRYAECSTPEIVTRVRSAGEADYVFVVNDRREFGTYVGQHGLVLEHGLPSDGNLLLNRSGVHVYDVLAGKQVATTPVDAKVSWPVQVGSCDGKVFLVTPVPIEQVTITADENIVRGNVAKLSIHVTSQDGKPVPAVIPVQVSVSDPNGRPAEVSGYHATNNGVLQLQLDVATNDTPGVWQIHVQELASRQTATHYLRVTP